ncbi:N-acetylmuramoyl-L-alanine amidase [Listeria monocytogenes]
MANYSNVTSNAGHSQKSEGAAGNGYEEHDEALKYNNDYIKLLQSYGVKVTNTTSEASSQNAVLTEQVKKANAVNKAGRLDVSWHFNSAADKSATGVEVLYYDQSGLAKEVSAALSKALGLRDRGAKQRKDLYFLANTNAPAILIEVAFISNANDMKAATTKRAAAVNAVAKVTTGKTSGNANKAAAKPSTTSSNPKGKVNVHKTQYNGKDLFFPYGDGFTAFAKVLFNLSAADTVYDEAPFFPAVVKGWTLVQANVDVQLFEDKNLTKKSTMKLNKGDQALSLHIGFVNK